MANQSKFGLQEYVKAVGIIGTYDITDDKKVKIGVTNAGSTNVFVLRGRIQGQDNFVDIGSVTGVSEQIFDVSTFDFLQLACTTYSSLSTYVEVHASGFDVVSSSGGGGGSADSTAANQVIGNASLASIDGKLTSQATAANQVIGNASLASIDSKISSQATAANQTTANSKLDSIITQTTVTKGGGNVDANTQRVTLAADGPGVQNLADIKTAIQLLDDVVGVTGSTIPSKSSLIGFQDSSGNIKPALLTENGSLSVGNGVKKFRDGFADLAQGASPDSSIWDIAWTNQADSFVGRAGNAQGASYMKISMSPLVAGSEFSMTTKRSFKYPMRFISMLSLSQRIVGQEFEVSIVGVDGTSTITNLTSKSDLTILGTVSITSNVATINFSSAHGLQTSDRVILVGNTERRLNVGPVQVTVITATQITVPCTLANGTYTAGGVVRWADPLAYAKNGAGLLHENATATNATFLTRRNGFNTRLLNSTIVTTANATTVNYADPFNATSMNQILANQEEFTIIPRTPDAITAPSTPLRWHQGIPDEELEYKIRIRAKNLDNMTRPIARITAISKTGTTTATVTTDVAHGLTVTDFVQIYGVRDITNFPNLTASTQVASIVSPTQFTIVIGAAVTASSAGGTVIINQGSVLAPGISAINVQSIARTSNIVSLTGNTTWTGYLPGETIHLYGCDATSMGLYDGAYKVLRINAAILELESVGADFTSLNCGGAVMRRTDFRIHTISEIEHTRLIAELSNSQGSSDLSKSVPVNVNNTPAVTISSGTVTTVSTVTAVTAVTAANLAIPGTIADVASAALTTTTTTAATTPTFGTAYQVNIPVTVVSGTTPTLDVVVQESDDSGTNWYDAYHFPRITATGMYRSPVLPLVGNRVRYVQTVSGTTPSFTRAINRSQLSWNGATLLRQLFDRAISLTTLSAATAALVVGGCDKFELTINIGTATTAPALQLQISEDGANWISIGTPLTAVASSTVKTTVTGTAASFVRAIVTTAGVTVVSGFVQVKGYK